MTGRRARLVRNMPRPPIVRDQSRWIDELYAARAEVRAQWVGDRIVYHVPIPERFNPYDGGQFLCRICGHPNGQHATLRPRMKRRLLIWWRFGR